MRLYYRHVYGKLGSPLWRGRVQGSRAEVDRTRSSYCTPIGIETVVKDEKCDRFTVVFFEPLPAKG